MYRGTTVYQPYCKFALALLFLVAVCVWINTRLVSRAIWNTDEMKFVVRFLHLRRPFKGTEEWKETLSSHGPPETGCLGLLVLGGVPLGSVPFHFGRLMSGSNFCLLLCTLSWWHKIISIECPLENRWRPSLLFGILTGCLQSFDEQRKIVPLQQEELTVYAVYIAPVLRISGELELSRVFLLPLLQTPNSL